MDLFRRKLYQAREALNKELTRLMALEVGTDKHLEEEMRSFRERLGRALRER